MNTLITLLAVLFVLAHGAPNFYCAEYDANDWTFVMNTWDYRKCLDDDRIEGIQKNFAAGVFSCYKSNLLPTRAASVNCIGQGLIPINSDYIAVSEAVHTIHDWILLSIRGLLSLNLPYVHHIEEGQSFDQATGCDSASYGFDAGFGTGDKDQERARCVGSCNDAPLACFGVSTSVTPNTYSCECLYSGSSGINFAYYTVKELKVISGGNAYTHSYAADGSVTRSKTSSSSSNTYNLKVVSTDYILTAQTILDTEVQDSYTCAAGLNCIVSWSRSSETGWSIDVAVSTAVKFFGVEIDVEVAVGHSSSTSKEISISIEEDAVSQDCTYQLMKRNTEYEYDIINEFVLQGEFFMYGYANAYPIELLDASVIELSVGTMTEKEVDYYVESSCT